MDKIITTIKGFYTHNKTLIFVICVPLMMFVVFTAGMSVDQKPLVKTKTPTTNQSTQNTEATSIPPTDTSASQAKPAAAANSNPTNNRPTTNTNPITAPTTSNTYTAPAIVCPQSLRDSSMALLVTMRNVRINNINTQTMAYQQNHPNFTYSEYTAFTQQITDIANLAIQQETDRLNINMIKNNCELVSVPTI